jgi:hypothetical protein
MAKPMSTSPPITVDRVDKMYHQLAEIHAITAVQLAECARWRQSDPTPSPVRVGTGQQRLTVKPSVARLAPSPLLISCPEPCSGGRLDASSSRPAARLTRRVRAHCPSTTHRVRSRASIATFLGTHSRSCAASPPSYEAAMLHPI